MIIKNKVFTQERDHIDGYQNTNQRLFHTKNVYPTLLFFQTFLHKFSLHH